VSCAAGLPPSWRDQWFFFLGSSTLSGSGLAQNHGKIKGKGDGQIRVSEADRRSSSTQELGEINIEGRMYKPSVFYVLARGALAYEGLKIQHDYVPLILHGALKRFF
jgi:hypothetical protein